MANENNFNNQYNRQPSMRDLANERMKQLRGEAASGSNGPGEKREASNVQRTRTASPDNVRRESRPVSGEQRVRREASDSRSIRSISPEGTRRPSSDEQRIKREAPDAVRERRLSDSESARERRIVNPEASRERRVVNPDGTRERRGVNPESARERRSASPEGARRPSSGEQRIRRDSDADRARKAPAGNSSKRIASRDAIETERRINKSSHAAGNTRNSSSSKKDAFRPAAGRKKPRFFIIGLGIYTAILLVLAGIFLVYTDVCLKKYEKSQSEYYMNTYIEKFEKKAKEGTFTPSDFTFSGIDMTFASKDMLLGNYISDLKDYSSFTAEKDSSVYITEAPVYNILADGEVIAKVTLKAVSQTKIFAILTVMDWDVDKFEPVCSIEVTDFVIMAPKGYTVIINGIPVEDSYKTGSVITPQQFAYVSKYVEMPCYEEYKIDTVLSDSSIKVLNPLGEEVTLDTDDKKIVASFSAADSDLSEDRKNEALKMVQTYEDFNTDDLSGPSHGLATVQSFLIKDSDYWKMAKEWAGGVDITFTSAHTFDNPKYSDVVVDNYAEYSDVCYSLHIAFSKNLILTRTKEKITNDFDSTVFFVYYDDSDDGVDNPHWCIADMIATTNN